MKFKSSKPFFIYLTFLKNTNMGVLLENVAINALITWGIIIEKIIIS